MKDIMQEFSEALSEILFNQVIPVQKRSIGTGKGAKKGYEDNQESEEHVFAWDYKLVLFSPADWKPRKTRIPLPAQLLGSGKSMIKSKDNDSCGVNGCKLAR